MKTLIICCCLLFSVALSYGQENPPNIKFFSVHEDVVRPSLASNYESELPRLHELVIKAGLHSGLDNAWVTDDYVYRHITPIENPVEFFEDGMAFMGGENPLTEEEMNEMSVLGNTQMITHRSYFIVLAEDLSYKPTGASPGNYFKIQSFRPDFSIPESARQEVIKEWKTLLEKHDSPLGYDIYFGSFGYEQAMLVMWRANDPVDFEQKWQKMGELLGEEATTLWSETISQYQKYEEAHGWIRDLTE